jgi:hypothetical protein
VEMYGDRDPSAARIEAAFDDEMKMPDEGNDPSFNGNNNNSYCI